MVSIPTFVYLKYPSIPIKGHYENSQQKWLIYDVDIFGVSIVQTYRNQFSAALKTQSFEQFLVELGKNS